MNDKFAIWGTGDSGKILFNKLSLLGEVVCWYGDELVEESIYGVPIKKYKKKEYKKEKIIITDTNWLDVCNTLEKSGLEVAKDYFPAWMLNSKMIGWKNILKLKTQDMEKCLLQIKNKRKIAIVYGNCQTELIQRFLEQSESFMSQYIIINIPRVCQEDENIWNEIISSNIFYFCDLFIYQIVLDSNKFGYERATSNIINKLHKNCRKVSIPNIYFDGYFPQVEKNKYNIMEDIQEDGLFKWGDRYVNEFIRKGMSKENIIKTIFDDDFIDENIIKEAIDKSFHNLLEREKNTDIKISDYIKANYSNRQLFYAPNHPNNELLKVMVNRILQYLGENTVVFGDAVDGFVSLMGEDIVVYPSVIKYLNMKKYYREFFPNRYIENLSYSAKGYYGLYYDMLKNKILEDGRYKEK